MQLEIGHNVQCPMQSEVCLWGIRQSAIICNAMHALMFRQLVYDASDILVRFPNPLVLPRASGSEKLTTDIHDNWTGLMMYDASDDEVLMQHRAHT